MGKKHLNSHDTYRAFKPLCKYWPLAVEDNSVEVAWSHFHTCTNQDANITPLFSHLLLAQSESVAPQHPAARFPQAAVALPVQVTACRKSILSTELPCSNATAQKVMFQDKQ